MTQTDRSTAPWSGTVPVGAAAAACRRLGRVPDAAPPGARRGGRQNEFAAAHRAVLGGLTGSLAAGAWNIVARSALAARGVDEAGSARSLALMHMAGFDANVACHHSKYIGGRR